MTRLLRRTKAESATETANEADREATESTEVTEPTEPTPSVEATESTETTEPTKSTESTETTEPTKSTESTVSPEAEATPEANATPEAEEPRATGAAPRRSTRSAALWSRIALAAGLVALVLGGSWFFHEAHQLRTTPSARNHALTDTAATDRVSGDVADGLARVFSYTPADTDAAERSSRTVLAGRAARQYAELLAQVRANLVDQRITLSTQTVRTGVIELDGNSARLLVFLDQTSRRDKAAPTSAAAQLTVTAEYQGDRWRIVDIKAR
ncbi:hypothetical protein PUR59_35770 [Streptomyces sp. SP18ES09]|uniref:hypothetical protein n=1 Tax=Streptomyces sp. SP18ES09 TaxID=3002532 RepID=UPI002E76FF74|nr:hypothetical protein [Streptomyces sp. SP18ES09]MEE1820358.1 hypothetical protein [Streptomyces sp. SP18ES09]